MMLPHLKLLTVMRGMFALLMSTCLCIAVAQIATQTAAQTWQEQLPAAKQIGQGELSFWGFKIYKATLWSAQQPFDAHAPFALQLTYQRNISGQQLTSKTIEEIKRLFGARYSENQLQLWAQQLRIIFPDVKEGDEIIGVYLPQQGCRFYSKKSLLGDIKDSELADAFFAIWLDPRTKDEKLRRQLMGEH